MFYHFAFLAISLALFGSGASGVFVYLARPRLDDERTGVADGDRLRALPAASTVAALFVILAHPLSPLQPRARDPARRSPGSTERPRCLSSSRAASSRWRSPPGRARSTGSISSTSPAPRSAACCWCPRSRTLGAIDASCCWWRSSPPSPAGCSRAGASRWLSWLPRPRSSPGTASRPSWSCAGPGPLGRAGGLLALELLLARDGDRARPTRTGCCSTSTPTPPRSSTRTPPDLQRHAAERDRIESLAYQTRHRDKVADHRAGRRRRRDRGAAARGRAT